MSLRHWLQLSLAEGIGPRTVSQLLAAAGSAEAACARRWTDAGAAEGLSGVRIKKISAALKQAADEIDNELERCRAAGARLICREDAEYPPLLRIIPDPPSVLYVKGTIEARDLNAIAMVGSRQCSLYGREQADRFAALLAGAGFTIVSGGARGVDSAAHRGALAAENGRTIAVLGCGVDMAYPPENESLFAQIAARGAVISEFAIETPPLRENFPRRNRIVSGMSRGVLVIEADVVSGALITARQACDDHDRPVFALPGRVDNPLSAGPHSLIRDGATLTTSLEDILADLHPLPAGIDGPDLAALTPGGGEEKSAASNEHRDGAEAAVSSPASLNISERQSVILGCLDGSPVGVDAIIGRTQLPAEIVLQELTVMTLRGMVRRADGQTFSKR